MTEADGGETEWKAAGRQLCVDGGSPRHTHTPGKEQRQPRDIQKGQETDLPDLPKEHRPASPVWTSDLELGDNAVLF